MGVRQQDLDSWVGEPVSSLELHPIFITIPVVKTKASDGTEIWNYVNGANSNSCSAGSDIFSGYADMASYNTFANCMSRVMACNNIFYIKDGLVMRYVAVGTGGARCYTNEAAQPEFRGSIDIY
jgi:hypothetical protein